MGGEYPGNSAQSSDQHCHSDLKDGTAALDGPYRQTVDITLMAWRK
jgi:hypothetical protein